jgi:sugar phosphate isomerase/epimerase
MLQLAAFVDGISPDLDEQLAVCRANGIGYVELHHVGEVSVLELDATGRWHVAVRLDRAGLKVSSIAGPIGKVRINEPWEVHFARFKLAVEVAAFFQAPFLRISSCYPPEPDQDIRRYRDEVLRRMREMIQYVAAGPVTLLHENDMGTYGERAEQCLDLAQSLNHWQFRLAFDFANFVRAGEDPAEIWPRLAPWVSHMHIAAAVSGSESPVAAGAGDSRVEEVLAQAWADGYRGCLSFSPHIPEAKPLGRWDGAERFKAAAEAVKDLCRRRGIPVAGVNAAP